MKPEVVLQALLAIWDELPALVGADWPKILQDLEAHLDRLKATQDPDITTELVLVLRVYPSARARLQAAAAAESASAQERTVSSDRPTPTRRTTRGLSADLETAGEPDNTNGGGLGGGDGGPAVAAGPSLAVLTDRISNRLVESRQALDAEPAMSAAARLATCHVHAEMDQTVFVDRITTVEVIVSRETIGGAFHEAAAESAAEVDPDKRLIIQTCPRPTSRPLARVVPRSTCPQPVNPRRCTSTSGRRTRALRCPAPSAGSAGSRLTTSRKAESQSTNRDRSVLRAMTASCFST